MANPTATTIFQAMEKPTSTTIIEALRKPTSTITIKVVKEEEAPSATGTNAHDYLLGRDYVAAARSVRGALKARSLY
jgi:hypothetical protein